LNFHEAGHSKPVDIWAMGVITYFLLCGTDPFPVALTVVSHIHYIPGYTPFDRDTQQLEMEAIIAGDYKFEPAEYWANVSPTARAFVTSCLTIDPTNRPTAQECLEHKWLSSKEPHFVPDPESKTGAPMDLLPHIQKQFNAKKTCGFILSFSFMTRRIDGRLLVLIVRSAVLSMMAVKRLANHTARPDVPFDLQKCRDEAEAVRPSQLAFSDALLMGVF
jgi:serine/threonine protein kinase